MKWKWHARVKVLVLVLRSGQCKVKIAVLSQFTYYWTLWYVEKLQWKFITIPIALFPFPYFYSHFHSYSRDNMSRAVYQRRTVTCLTTLTESDCTVVLQQKCDNATLIIFISTTTTTTTSHCHCHSHGNPMGLTKSQLFPFQCISLL